jgi:hypothetical protein
MKGILCSVTIALALTALGCGGSTAPTPTGPQWSVSGTVRGNGAAIGGAVVTLMRQPLPVIVMQTTTDAAGRYQWPSVDQGSYFVSAAAAGYVTEILPITLSSSQTVDFDLPLNPSR